MAPDIALVGGDIGVASELTRFLRILDREIRLPVYFVLGNHDCYGSSIKKVRAEAAKLRDFQNLNWLPMRGVVRVTERTALVGYDGWADGRFGNFEQSEARINDYELIEDFWCLSRAEIFQKLNALGDEAAGYFACVLPQAFEIAQRVVVLTHVPPFREACWHQGQISGDDYLPHFSCKAVGEVLVSVMNSLPEYDLLVLCGHTHSSGEVRILPNLTVKTGAAVYGWPRVQELLLIH